MKRITFVVLAVALLAVAACSSSKHNTAPNASTTTTTSGRPNPAIGTVPATAWRTAAQGVFDSKPWTVQIARSTKNWLCYAGRGSAAPSAAAVAAVPTAGSTPQGQPTQCLEPGSDPKPPFTAFIAGPDKSQWVLVGAVAPAVRRVAIIMKNGSTTPLNVSPSTRLIEWKGPASLTPQHLRLDATTCALSAAAATASSPACAGVAA
jgi:hypothetical protein